MKPMSVSSSFGIENPVEKTNCKWTGPLVIFYVGRPHSSQVSVGDRRQCKHTIAIWSDYDQGKSLVLSNITRNITLRPEQNGRHFADDILKNIFLNLNYCILIQSPLKRIPMDTINNKPFKT